MAALATGVVDTVAEDDALELLDELLAIASVSAVPRTREPSTPMPIRDGPRRRRYTCAPAPMPKPREGTTVFGADAGNDVPPGSPDMAPRTSMTYGPGEDDCANAAVEIN